jgi:PAS domain S-box-containing protein
MGCLFQKKYKTSFLEKILTFLGINAKKIDGYGSISGMEVANLQAILDTTVDSIITVTEERSIVAFNKTAEKMFGYSKKEVVGKNINLLMPEPFYSEHDCYVQNYLRSDNKKIMGIGREVVAKRKDGTTFPINLAVSEVIVKNSRLFTGIIRDISMEKEAEINKIESIRLEAEMKAKNEFITMISHELRTPLHSIMGFIECLINEIDGPINETQKKSLHHSFNASQHLLHLVNGILELSKIVSLQMEENKETCDIAEILYSCIDTIAPLAKQKNIELIKNVSNLPFLVNANPKHIHQILLNLLSNAVKFTDNGKIVCGITTTPENTEVIIQDTGIGIEPQNIPKIFIPFVRLPVNGSKDSLRPGLGLGLAITKQLVELYKGKIEVSSKNGEGSQFKIILPKKEINKVKAYE